MLTYDPMEPFPEPLTPGEFGRAWVDSLYHNDRPTYDQKVTAGTLQAEATAVEKEAQQQMGAILSQTTERFRPAGLTPMGWMTQRELTAREIVMEGVRVPPADSRPSDS